MPGSVGRPAGHHAGHGQRDPETEPPLLAGQMAALLHRTPALPPSQRQSAESPGRRPEIDRETAQKGKPQSSQSERWGSGQNGGQIEHVSCTAESGSAAGNGQSGGIRSGASAVLHGISVAGRLQSVRRHRVCAERGLSFPLSVGRGGQSQYDVVLDGGLLFIVSIHIRIF